MLVRAPKLFHHIAGNILFFRSRVIDFALQKVLGHKLTVLAEMSIVSEMKL